MPQLLPAARPLVLVVEDEPLVGNMLRLVLQRQGCSVLLASSGEEAVERFRGDCPVSLVLLDVRMAGMDGPQTLRVLQDMDPYVRCCFITGDTGKYSELDLLRAGAMRVIKKPFRLQEIEQVLLDCAPAAKATPHA